MKIYTRTGDDGSTALFGGGRVPKDHARVEAYGTLDELNALLGWCLGEVADPDLRNRLELVQHDLFTLGAELATPPPAEGRSRPSTPPLPIDRIGQMETWMDEAEGELETLRVFVLPGGSPGARALHVARTVCRRAERRVVHLAAVDSVDPAVVKYLNRLSDLLFTFARLANRRGGTSDVAWSKP